MTFSMRSPLRFGRNVCSLEGRLLIYFLGCLTVVLYCITKDIFAINNACTVFVIQVPIQSYLKFTQVFLNVLIQQLWALWIAMSVS